MKMQYYVQSKYYQVHNFISAVIFPYTCSYCVLCAKHHKKHSCLLRLPVFQLCSLQHKAIMSQFIKSTNNTWFQQRNVFCGLTDWTRGLTD